VQPSAGPPAAPPAAPSLPRPWSPCPGYQSGAPRLERRPYPRARRLKTLEGVGGTARARLAVTPPSLPRVAWPRLAGHGAENRARQGLAGLGGFPQPQAHRGRLYLAPPGRGPEAQALSHARQPAPAQCAHQARARPARAGRLQNVAGTSAPGQRSPQATAGLARRAERPHPPPAGIVTARRGDTNAAQDRARGRRLVGGSGAGHRGGGPVGGGASGAPAAHGGVGGSPSPGWGAGVAGRGEHVAPRLGQASGSLTQRHKRPRIAPWSSTWGALLATPPHQGGEGHRVPGCGAGGLTRKLVVHDQGLTVLRAAHLPSEAAPKKIQPRLSPGSLAAGKASRELGGHGVGAKCVASSGALGWLRSSEANESWLGPRGAAGLKAAPNIGTTNGAQFHKYNCSTRKRSVLSETREEGASAYPAGAVGRSPLSSPIRRLRAGCGRPLQGVCGRLLHHC